MSHMKGIEISLKPIAGGINRVLPPDVNQVLQLEYANKYLESIGAYPTRENVDFVLNNLAIKDALVLPVWARSKIIIIPGMSSSDGDLGASMQELLSENQHETSPKHAESRKQRSKNRSKQAEAELESLTRGAKSSYTNKVGRRLSWTTVNTLDLLEPLVNVLQVNQRVAESFKLLLRPPDFGNEDIGESLHMFITTLADYIPRVRQDRTFKLFKSVRKLLKSKACMQLYGLLVHFCYWNIIHPTARHTVHTLRERQPVPEATVFQDVDLNPNSMLMMRSTLPSVPTTPGVSGLNTARSAMSIERMFVGEMLQGSDEEDAPRPLSSTHSRPGSSAGTTLQHGASTRSVLSTASNSVSGSRSNSPTAAGRAGSPSFFPMSLSRSPSARKVEFNLSAKASQRFKSSSTLGVGAEVVNGTVDARLSTVHSPSQSSMQSPTQDEIQRALDEDSLEESETEEYQEGGAKNAHLRRGSTATRAFSPGAGSRGSGGRGSPLSQQFGQYIEGGLYKEGNYENYEGGSLAGNTADTEASLSAHEKEQLFMQMEACLISLFKKVGKKKVDLVTGRQALVTCCHFIVDEVLTAAYPWFAPLADNGNTLKEHTIHSPAYLDFANKGADWAGPYADNVKQLNLRLRRLVHQGLADIIDPSRLYTSSMLLSTVTGKINLRTLANKGKSRFYTTSMATKALLGDSQSDAARRFLQQGRGVYTVLPGVVDPYSGRNTLRSQTATPEVFDILRGTEFGSGKHTTNFFDTKNTTTSSKSNVVVPPLQHPMLAPVRAQQPTQTQFHTHTMPQSAPKPQSAKPATRQESSKPNTSSAQNLSTSRTFAERVNSSAARASTASGRNNCHKFGSGIPRGPIITAPPPKTKLDFGNLFADQPDVGYFPVLKTGAGASAGATLCVSSSENDWLNEFLPAGSRAVVKEPTHSHAEENPVVRQVFSAGSVPDTFRMPSGFEHDDQGADMFGAVPMFPSNESVGSNSYLSENRSIVLNKSAVQPISLRAKTSLMELLVDKTNSLYATEIQTNQVKTRRELLNLTSKRK